jgi:hypothetical protein
MSDAAAALQNKTGKARAVTVSELLQSDLKLNPTIKAQLRQMLLSSWNSLPARQRNELIQFRWEQVGDPEWLPILRTIVLGEPNRAHNIDQPERAAALRRIYEIEPDEGRELILREIANPKGDIGIGVLGLLPERELPQIEQPTIAKLNAGNGSDLDFQLLERYASKSALSDITHVYERHIGEWACSPQTAMLLYFLRVSPSYGTLQVGDAMSERKATGCCKFQLTALEELIRRPKIEKIAINSLNDPDPEVVTNAAEALGRYGSLNAEGSLWTRLEKLHEEWKHQTDELHYSFGTKPDVLAAMRLEQVLVQAITNGQAWLANENTIGRLKDLASPNMQPELDAVLQEIQRGEYQLVLNWWPEGTLRYNVGPYSGKGMAALKDKLAQLPGSAHLNVVTTVAERERHKAEFAEVENAAAAEGLLLQIQTPR